MDFFKTLDFYCERITNSFWAEPLNAVSNIGFIVVGFIFLKKYNQLSKWTTFFSINSIIIGIGSFLFHTFANVWSLFTDIIPIMILISSFFFYSFRELLNKSNLLSSIFTILIVFAGVILEYTKLDFLNGSDAYLHVLASLVFFSFALRQQLFISNKFRHASFVFMISLIFRTVDNVACGLNPYGTHFLWHLNNSYLIYILISISNLKNRKMY